eukprot:Gb_02727 [translate_table: standard]
MGIIIQGDRTSEIFFIKSGECRVVMELHKGPRSALRPLPRATSGNYRLNRSTKYSRGESEARNRERGQTESQHLLSTRSQSVPLPYLSRTSNTLLKGKLEGIQESSANQLGKTLTNKRHVSPRRLEGAGSFKVSHDTGRAQSKEPSSQAQKHCIPCSRIQLVSKQIHNSPVGRQEEKQTMLPAKSYMRNKPSIMDGSYKMVSSTRRHQFKSCLNGQGHEHQIQEKARSVGKSNKKQLSKTCTLMSLIREFGNKDPEISFLDLDATDRKHESWYVESDGTALLKGDVNDEALSESKVNLWARNAIFTEKKRRAEPANARQTALELPTAALCSTRDPITEDTIFLEIGALYEGEFFGEIDPLHQSKWKASILTVTPVEVFVLQNSDFHRYIDKDRVACLSENEFKSVEHIYQEYQKTRKWALYKRKVMREVLEFRRQRFPHRSEHEQRKHVP